jgi:hypothetical protein
VQRPYQEHITDRIATNILALRQSAAAVVHAALSFDAVMDALGQTHDPVAPIANKIEKGMRFLHAFATALRADSSDLLPQLAILMSLVKDKD